MLALQRIVLAPDAPAGPEHGRRNANHTDPALAARGPILVVDDDEAILAMLRDFLESEGMEVRTATNGEEALAALNDVEPALILLDMRMPVLDGWGFAERFRERRLSYPIVVMTAAESARGWAAEIGATSYIAKPFDVNELLQMIERHGQKDSRPN